MTVNVSQAVANVPNSTGTGAQRILRFKPSGDSRYYSVNSKSINVALLEEGMSFQKVVKEFYDVEDVATNLQQIPVAHTGAGMQQKGIVKKLLRQHSARTLLGRTKRQEKLVGGAQILIIEDAPKEDISKLVTWLYAKPRDGIKVLRSVETPQFMKLEPAEKRKAEPAVTERIDLKKDFGPAVERKNVASSFREKAVMTLASAAIGSLTGFGLSRLFPPSLPTPLAAPHSDLFFLV